MAKTSIPRADLLKQLEETLRKVGAQSVLLSDNVARLVRLDRLAKHAGRTAGAMPAVIDRLERAGFARRLRDAEDRRCVRVEALPRNFRHVAGLYRRLAD